MEDKEAKYITFDCKESKGGKLMPIENMDDIPFDINRVFIIYDVEDHVSRGNHGHKDLQEVLVPLKGECRVKIHNGYTQKEYHLNCPTKGLYIPKLNWIDMDCFKDCCILLVLCSDKYNEDDTIYSFDEFKELAQSYREL